MVMEHTERPSDMGKSFWQQWQQYRDYLYRCCIKWMGNPTDAEDALSRAMLKAWEKVQKYAAGGIANFKAWLTSLTKNLCVDIYRERARGANRVENIEVYAAREEEGLVSPAETPESALEADEKKFVIRRAIDNLPPRLRETFIPHYYKELSYQEIAQEQGISYDNVCKRISMARKILREELKAYFIGEDGTGTDSPVPLAATESAIGEKSEGNAEVEPIVGEELILSVAVEEVLDVAGESPQEVAQPVLEGEPAPVAATSDDRVEGKGEGCRWVEPAIGERQPVPVLAVSILLKQLRGFFIGEKGTETDSSVPLAATESAKGEMSQGNAGVEPIVGEELTFSVAVEEVLDVAGGEPQEVGLPVLPSETASVAATSDG